MVSTIGVAQINDSEACDNSLQTGHLMSRKLVKKKFHSKDFKILLTRFVKTDERNTVNKRRVTVFCKLVIVSFVMGFKKNFKVRAPKCRFDEIHQKTR